MAITRGGVLCCCPDTILLRIDVESLHDKLLDRSLSHKIVSIGPKVVIRAPGIETDLLRSEIIADGFLETFANPLFGDRIEIALGENRVNDAGILIACFSRDCRTKLVLTTTMKAGEPALESGATRSRTRHLAWAQRCDFPL